MNTADAPRRRLAYSCAPVLQIAPLAIVLAAGMCRAGELGTPALGVLAPVVAEVQLTVARESLWQAPQAGFVRPDSVVVADAKRRPLSRVASEPCAGEFALLPEGVIRFSPEEAGRRVFVRYQFSPRRVVLLKTAPPTDYPDAAASLDCALAEELGRCGFVIVPVEEVVQAAAAAGLEATASPEPARPEKLVAFAQRVNATYVIGAAIAIAHSSRQATLVLDTGAEQRRERVGDRHPGNPLAEESTMEVPVTRERLFGEVRLAAVDGGTGAPVASQVQSSVQKVRLYRFSLARKALVRKLARQAVAAWRTPSAGREAVR